MGKTQKKGNVTMQFEYKTSGTCSREILFEIEDGKLKNVQYIGGCNGNLKGIGSLVEGMDIESLHKCALDDRRELHQFAQDGLLCQVNLKQPLVFSDCSCR